MKEKMFILPLILLLLNAANVFAQKKDTSEKSNDVYLKMAQVLPKPIGGISAIQKNVIYPVATKKEGIEGMVYINAFIDEKGDVTKTKIIKGIGSGCDEAAMEAIKKTKFTPAKMRDKLVKMQIVVPVKFELNKSKVKN